MSEDIGKVVDIFNEFTKVELPGGGGLETDSPVVEAAVAVGVLGKVRISGEILLG